MIQIILPIGFWVIYLAMLLRYYHTLRHLRPTQWAYQLYSRLRRPPTPDLRPAPLLAVPNAGFVPHIPRDGILGDGYITLLHRSIAMDSLGSPWYVSGESALWNYHLHYHEQVQPQWVARWIAENPPGNGIGWQAYPISRRVAYWILAARAQPGTLPPEALHSLAIQVRYLFKQLEYHLLANHLFANIKALYLAGHFFTGDEADGWRRLALKLLHREIPRQFLADGGHCERSPMYHALMLEDLLDMQNIAPHHLLEASIPKALGYLQHVTHADGTFGLFNDTALNIAPSTAALLEYAARLGLTPAHVAPQHVRRIQSENWDILWDVGEIGCEYQPGHAHADSLSFEACFAGQKLITHVGTSEYGITNRRALERSTAAHNTLVLDGNNSSDVWGSFRVGKRAKPLQDGDWHGHDGYAPIRHFRQLMIENNTFIIHDKLLGSGTHAIEITLHFIPGTAVTPTHITTATGYRLEIQSDTPPVVEAYLYAPEFGRTIPTQKLVWRYPATALPWQHRIALLPIG